jgi:dipeptidyl aminopeptidase/acylaminoacyl peptidase
MQARSYADLMTYRGKKLVGILNRPAGPDGKRYPAVLFLHGYPGAEKNVDIQRALLSRGVASFALHFRGAWGSEGKYSFMDLPEQGKAALAFMRKQEFVDPERLAVFGFSMGGWAALNLAGLVPLKACMAVAPVGGPEMVGPGTADTVARLGRVLKLPGRKMAKEFVAAVTKRDPAISAKKAGCPLLIAHGEKDVVVPFPVSKRIAAVSGARLVPFKEAGHDFLEQREELTLLAADWLSDRLK